MVLQAGGLREGPPPGCSLATSLHPHTAPSQPAPGPVTRAPILSTRAPPPTSSAPNTVTVEGLLHRVTLGAHTCHPWQPSAPMFLRTNQHSRRAPEVPYPPAAGSPPRAAPVRQVMGASQHRSRTVVNVPGRSETMAWGRLHPWPPSSSEWTEASDPRLQISASDTHTARERCRVSLAHFGLHPRKFPTGTPGGQLNTHLSNVTQFGEPQR